MFTLSLYDMRTSENGAHPTVLAETRQELLDLLKVERCAAYKDGNGIKKVFREGGALEWYQPVSKRDPNLGIIDIGDEETAAEAGREKFRDLVNSIPIRI